MSPRGGAEPTRSSGRGGGLGGAQRGKGAALRRGGEPRVGEGGLVLLSVGVGEVEETVPLGAASVAAALKRAFGEALPLRILEGGAGEGPTLLLERLLAARPRLVGFSVYLWNRPLLAELARLLRASGFEGPLFAGGPEASSDPARVAEDFGLDFVVVGEGEGSLVRAFGRLLGEGTAAAGKAPAPGTVSGGALREALRGLPGIYLPGETLTRAPAPPVTELPSPWLSGLLGPEGRDEVLWELSRGCPFHCAYCFEGRGEGGVRFFPAERIEAELDLLIKGGARRIFVLDPTFNWKRERALGLLELFARRAPGVTWKFEVRAEFLDRALARAFARLDTSLQIGLQSSNPRALALVGRPGFDPERFAEKMAILDEAGLTWGLDLIYGLPGDDLASFGRSLDYALGLGPNHLDIFPLAVLPGTPLAERAGELGLEVEPRAPHLLLSSPGFPAGDLALAASLAGATELFYSRGRAVSWFLRALAPLKTRPSRFLGAFGAWLEEEGISGRAPGGHRAVEELQLAFLEREYRAKGREALLPLLRDIVRFEGAWTRALAEGESSLLELSYPAEFLLEPPSLDLRDLHRLGRPRPGRYRVLPARGGPRLEPLR